MSGTVQTNAFTMLKAIYDQIGGDTQEVARSDEAATRTGLDARTARAALGYLFGKGLLEDTREAAELPAVCLTARGVDAVESALASPTRATSYFPAVQNIINIQNFNGGGIQQGTNSSVQNVQAVVQPSVDAAALVAEFARIRAELLKGASSPEDFIAIGRIAEAEKAVADGDTNKAGQIMGMLGAASKGVLEVGLRVGADVAVSYLKARLGLP